VERHRNPKDSLPARYPSGFIAKYGYTNLGSATARRERGSNSAPQSIVSDT
jgi:hypothetical protein